MIIQYAQLPGFSSILPGMDRAFYPDVGAGRLYQWLHGVGEVTSPSATRDHYNNIVLKLQLLPPGYITLIQLPYLAIAMNTTQKPIHRNFGLLETHADRVYLPHQVSGSTWLGSLIIKPGSNESYWRAVAAASPAAAARGSYTLWELLHATLHAESTL